jgi:hypothetical protein
MVKGLRRSLTYLAAVGSLFDYLELPCVLLHGLSGPAILSFFFNWFRGTVNLACFKRIWSGFDMLTMQAFFSCSPCSLC